MSNPSINRWGLNLFWYNFWFNDKSTSLITQQSLFINKFIYIYVKFGLLHKKNIFINKYWYKNNNFNYKNIIEEFSLKYFRIIEYKSKIFNQNKKYKIRNHLKNTYFSRLWVLRFQNWLILNLYTYKPINKKKKKIINFKKEISGYSNFSTKINYKTIRLKFFFSYFLLNLNKNFYYKF